MKVNMYLFSLLEFHISKDRPHRS